MSTWETVALLGIAALIAFWVFPGLKPALQKSAESPKDYMGVAIPIIGVILFAIFLVISVKGL